MQQSMKALRMHAVQAESDLTACSAHAYQKQPNLLQGISTVPAAI